MEMRQVLCDTMKELMEKHGNIIFMDADLAEANGTMSLRKVFKERAFDVGISEQNMASMAGGMNSYICTFTGFASIRICDQIAISLAYAKQSVKLREVLLNTVDYKGVVYIRMPRKEVPRVHGEEYKYDMLKADVLKEGEDVTIFSTGLMITAALEASKILESKGIKAEVISIPTIKPLDEETIIKSLAKTKRAVTIENHNVMGGLYSAIAEVLYRKCPTLMRSLGVQNHVGEVEGMKFLAKKYGMTAEDIARECTELVK